MDDFIWLTNWSCEPNELFHLRSHLDIESLNFIFLDLLTCTFRCNIKFVQLNGIWRVELFKLRRSDFWNHYTIIFLKAKIYFEDKLKWEKQRGYHQSFRLQVLVRFSFSSLKFWKLELKGLGISRLDKIFCYKIFLSLSQNILQSCH